MKKILNLLIVINIGVILYFLSLVNLTIAVNTPTSIFMDGKEFKITKPDKDSQKYVLKKKVPFYKEIDILVKKDGYTEKRFSLKLPFSINLNLPLYLEKNSGDYIFDKIIELKRSSEERGLIFASDAEGHIYLWQPYKNRIQVINDKDETKREILLKYLVKEGSIIKWSEDLVKSGIEDSPELFNYMGVDSEGNIVALRFSILDKKIMLARFDSDGNLMNSYNFKADLYPSGMFNGQYCDFTIGRDGYYYFLAGKNLYKMSSHGLVSVQKLGSKEEEFFYLPKITVNSKGDVFLSRYLREIVYKLAESTLIKHLEISPGDGVNKEKINILDMEVDYDDNLFVPFDVDGRYFSIWKYDSEGNHLSSFGGAIPQLPGLVNYSPQLANSPTYDFSLLILKGNKVAFTDSMPYVYLPVLLKVFTPIN